MLKSILPIAMLLCTASLFSDGVKLPKFIDFGSPEFENHFYQKEFSYDHVRTFPFNGAVEMSTFFDYITDEYDIHTAVETGTFKGNTTGCFATLFDTVYTVEISEEFFKESAANLQQFSNVFNYFGSSPSVLAQILPSLEDQRLLFYLDAHWYEDWPLLNELEVIAKTHKNNCIIVIDDFKVPGRNDIPYDTHKDAEYCIEYIRSSLRRIFNGYSIHYLIPKNANSRAKFVAIPKNWKA